MSSEAAKRRGSKEVEQMYTEHHTGTWRCHVEPNMVLQSDAREEPFLVPQRTFKTRVL